MNLMRIFFYKEKWLTKNMKIVYENIKDFECDKFGLNHALQEHLKVIHEGIKAFSCVICDKSFVQKSKLRWHFKTVHEMVKCF